MKSYIATGLHPELKEGTTITAGDRVMIKFGQKDIKIPALLLRDWVSSGYAVEQNAAGTRLYFTCKELLRAIGESRAVLDLKNVEYLQMFFYFVHSYSLEGITKAARLAGKNHSTGVYHYKKMADLLSTKDKRALSIVGIIKNKLGL